MPLFVLVNSSIQQGALFAGLLRMRQMLPDTPEAQALGTAFDEVIAAGQTLNGPLI